MKTNVRVEALDAAAYTVPTDQPEADGTFAWDATTMVLVQARAGGQVGLGWTYAVAAAAAAVRETLASAVVGRDALDIPAAALAMTRLVRNPGRQGLLSCAVSAVDAALWDLKARLLDLPLYRLLGAVRTEVPVYGSGGFTTYDDATQHAQLSHWVHEQRIGRVKIKVGESWGRHADRDLRRIRAARDTIGEQAELYIDANGGYTRKQAIRVGAAAHDAGVTWFEEPVSSEDLAGLREVRDQVLLDVTAGEYGWDLAYFQRMCEANAVDCLQIDISRCGGPTEWQRAAAVAAAHNIDVSAHCIPHQHVHVACATPNLRHMEWFHDHVRIESMFFDGTLDPTGGVLRPDPDRPGIGLELRTADADRYRVA